jgi:hypothetical protein
MEQTSATHGAFHTNLIKTNAKIRQDRAANISEDLYMQYKRRIEDMELEIRKCQRDKAGMLDLHPDSAFGLKVATDFNAGEFVEKRQDLGVKIHNLQLRLKIARTDFLALFGTTENGEPAPADACDDLSDEALLKGEGVDPA